MAAFVTGGTWPMASVILTCSRMDTFFLRTSGTTGAGVRGQPPVGGAGAGAIVELDWDGNGVWEYQAPMLHHDFERLPNGNTLVLLFEPLAEELTARIQGGFRTDEGPEEILGDLVHEVTPAGDVVYSWPSWEHLDPEEDVICQLESREEWTHQNSLKVTPNGDLVVSFRRIDTVGIVGPGNREFQMEVGARSDIPSTPPHLFGQRPCPAV